MLDFRPTNFFWATALFLSKTFFSLKRLLIRRMCAGGEPCRWESSLSQMRDFIISTG